jgi:hypothetical protein
MQFKDRLVKGYSDVGGVQSRVEYSCPHCYDSGLVEIEGNPLQGKRFPGTSKNLTTAFMHCLMCPAGQEMSVLLQAERDSVSV